MSLAEEVCSDFALYKTGRGNWELHWEDIAGLVDPHAPRDFNAAALYSTKGRKRTQRIYDHTAVVAASKLGSIIDSLVTPQGYRYQYVRPSDPNLAKLRSVKEWFETLSTLLFKRRYASGAGFAANNHEVFNSTGIYGTGVLFISEKQRYQVVHLSQIYLARNDDGFINKAFRYFPITNRELYQRWGGDESFKSQAEAAPNAESTVIHRVEENMSHDPEKIDSFKFTSAYVHEKTKTVLEKGGFHSFPYAVSRYRVSPNEVYGRSPVMDVLPAIKTANAQKKTVLKHGNLATDPVYLTHDDGILDARTATPGNVIAGGVNALGQTMVKVLPTGNLAVGQEFLSDERLAINDALFINLFQILVQNPGMTATEVVERVREKNNLLNPTIGRQESEYLTQITEREVDIISRSGAMPERPPELLEAEGDYETIFETPMARSRRAEEAAGTMRTLDYFLNVAAAKQDPSVLDNFDLDKMARLVSEVNGTPVAMLNTIKKRDEIRQQRAQQQQRAQEAQEAPGQAAMMKAAAGVAASE